MRASRLARWIPLALGILAVAAAVLVGIDLRLEDPASTRSLPAEDPYTHMAYVREHLRNGAISPLYEGDSIYPPGMHAFLAAFWIYSGAELMEIIRYMPVAFGAIGIAGMALLLWRHLGPAPAVVGAFAYALAPEVVFRTTMLSPTALDLAMIPFFLYILLELARGHLGWLGAAVPMIGYFAVMHPWLLLVLGAAGLLFVVSVLVLGWPATTGTAPRPAGLAAVIGLLGSGVALAAATGAAKELDPPAWVPMGPLVVVIFVLSLVPYLAVLLVRRRSDRLFAWREARRLPIWAAVPVALLLGGLLYAITKPAVEEGMPQYVNLEAMIGWPILGAAIAGLVVLPFVRAPIAHLAVGLTATTYPFVIHDLLSDPFWAHRTAAFLAIGAVILVGVATWAAEALLRTLGKQTHHLVKGRLRGRAGFPLGGRRIAPAAQAVGALVPLLLVAGSLGGSVYTNTPDPYNGWYRLFEDCDHAVLEQLADRIRSQPGAIVVTSSWQAQKVVSSFAPDPGRVWSSQSFFESASERDGIAIWLSGEGRPLYLVVDPHGREKFSEDKLRFVDAAPWARIATGCTPKGPDPAWVTVHVHTGTTA